MNNTVFYDIPADKDFIAFEAAMNTFDIDMEECNILLEMVDHKRRINERRSDVKVYQESGTADDLEMLYTEAENDSNQEKDGIIKTIGTKIQNAINAIITFFKNLFTKKVEDPQTQVDDITPDENTKLEGFKNALPKVIAIVAAAGAAGAGAWALHKKKFEEATAEDNSNENKPAAKNTKEGLLTKFKGIPDMMKNALNLNKTIDDQEGKTTDPEGKSFFATVRTWLSKKTAFIGNIGKSIGNKLGVGHKENAANTNNGEATKEGETPSTSQNPDESTSSTETPASNPAPAETSQQNNQAQDQKPVEPEKKEEETPTLNLDGLKDKMNGSQTRHSKQGKGEAVRGGKKGSAGYTGESVEDDDEGTEFMETALDRFMNGPLASIL